jgi:putative two-component system response regulator
MQRQQRILVVDDQLDALKTIAHVLKPLYQVQVATCAENALMLLDRQPAPDLLLLDVLMPGMDGYRLCELLKTQPGVCELPVIFLTSRGTVEDEVRAFEVGAADYVTKPIEPTRLKVRVATQLSLAKQLRDARSALAQSRRTQARLLRERSSIW